MRMPTIAKKSRQDCRVVRYSNDNSSDTAHVSNVECSCDDEANCGSDCHAYQSSLYDCFILAICSQPIFPNISSAGVRIRRHSSDREREIATVQ